VWFVFFVVNNYHFPFKHKFKGQEDARLGPGKAKASFILVILPLVLQAHWQLVDSSTRRQKGARTRHSGALPSVKALPLFCFESMNGLIGDKTLFLLYNKPAQQ
jgi:hypothetical protein